MNELINDKAVYRTAPATPGLLITYVFQLSQMPNKIPIVQKITFYIGPIADTS